MIKVMHTDMMRYQKSRKQDCIKNGLWEEEDEGKKRWATKDWTHVLQFQNLNNADTF